MAYDFTEVLPYEVTQVILQFFDAKDLSRFQSVCHRWRELGNDDNLWLHFCTKEGWLKHGMNKQILQEESLYPEKASENSPVFDLCIPPDTRLSTICTWKHLYIRLSHLNTNWRKGRYTVAPILRGHMDRVRALDCHGHCLVTSSVDKSLRIWDLRTYECTRRVRGHSERVTVVKIVGNLIVTGCEENTIRVIDSTNGKVLFTFIGHEGGVVFLEVVGSNLISASFDRTVRVWSLANKELLHILRMQIDDITCLSAFGKHALSGSCDTTLVLWNVETGTCVFQLIGHTEVVTCCQFDSDKIVSGSIDATVRIWSCSSGECSHVLEGHRENVVFLVYNSEVIASADSTIILLWSFEGKLLHTLSEHMGVVRCLHINEERLVSGGDNADQSMIIVWDFKKGEKMCTLHRHPTKLYKMWVGDTKVITTTPERDGTVTVLSFW